jgi:beta-glucosidase
MDLFSRPFGDESLLERIGSAGHRALARKAVAQSLVLLKNEGDALPLADPAAGVLVAGEAADDIGLQCGGWSIEWMGARGAVTPGTTLLDALRARMGSGLVYVPGGRLDDGVRAAYGIVVIAEPPYAEGVGDRADLQLPEADAARIARVRPHVDRLIVVQYSGRPLLIGDSLQVADAWVAAWLPGTEAAGIADVLLGEEPFTGRLSYAWPRDDSQVPVSALEGSGEAPQFPIGFGL